MASIVEKTQIRLEHDNGVVDGKQKYKSRTYSNIKEDATDENILAASGAINELSAKKVLNTKKVVTSVLS